MRWHRKFLLRLKSLFRRHQAEAELEEELQDHLEQEIEANLRAGMSAEEARYSAMRLAGPLSVYKEECRDARGLNLLDSLARDLRYGARVLRQNALFTAAAIITLALGIGANTNGFHLYQHHSASPAGCERSAATRLLQLGSQHEYVVPNYEDFRDRNDVLSGLAAYRFNPVSISIGNANELPRPAARRLVDAMAE